MKPIMPPIKLEDSKEDLAESTPLDSDRGSGSVSESPSNLPVILAQMERVAIRSTVRIQPISRPKQVTSKRPKEDKGGPSKKPKT